MGFRGAERGQSEVIGALLIFAVIVAFIGINQAFLVPQANEDVEFKHNNEVQRDIVNLRSATIEAAGSNEPRARSIDLGTDYPSRFIAINPPSATGTIRTEDGDGEIDATAVDLSSVCGTGSESVDTKFLTYRPNYNEHRNALPMTVENTVAYRDTATGPLFSTGQTFARGNQINIVRYVGNVEETTSGTVSLDLFPSKTGGITVNTSSEPLNITVPTRLSATAWDSLIDSSPVTPKDVEGENRVKFEFEDNSTYRVRCTTIGINQKPEVEPRNLAGDSDSEDKFDAINPATEGNILLHSVSEVNDNGESNVSITLENKSFATDTVTLDRARLNYFSGTSPGYSSENGVSYFTFPQSGSREFVAGGDFKGLENPIALNEDKTTVYLQFDGDVQNDDFYVLTLEFSDGNVDTYFVSHPNYGET